MRPGFYVKNKVDYILKNANKKNINDIAQDLGVSRSTIKRIGKKENIRFTFYKKSFYKRDYKKKVLKYYENHTLEETKKKFNNNSIRSIIETNQHKEKLSRWKENEIIYVIKNYPKKNMKEIAGCLKRPNAMEGSIRSLYLKRLKFTGNFYHGLPKYKARIFVNKQCKYEKIGFYNIASWENILKYKKTDCPNVVIKIAKSMILFKNWIKKF